MRKHNQKDQDHKEIKKKTIKQNQNLKLNWKSKMNKI